MPIYPALTTATLLVIGMTQAAPTRGRDDDAVLVQPRREKVAYKETFRVASTTLMQAKSARSPLQSTLTADDWAKSANNISDWHAFAGTQLRPGAVMLLDDLHRLEIPGKQCLDFIHIPKAAGTSVEQASLALAGSQMTNGVVGWGKEDGQLHCDHPQQDKVGTVCDIRRNSQVVGRSYIWHQPPSWDKKLANSYEKCTTFCITREPVGRAVSEWKYFGGCNGEQGDVNEYIRTNLQAAESNPFVGGGHWLPQTEYVRGHAVTFKGEMSAEHEYCQRVLRLENLTAEFNALMEEFGFDVTLGAVNTRVSCHPEVSEQTRELIRNFYDVDYKTFGY